jgi:hypothetical protein
MNVSTGIRAGFHTSSYDSVPHAAVSLSRLQEVGGKGTFALLGRAVEIVFWAGFWADMRLGIRCPSRLV